jgi:hypothetical protein
LLDAVEHGYISTQFVTSQIELGNVRPSLQYQLDRKLADPRLIPGSVVRSDLAKFVPPHRRNHSGTFSTRTPTLRQAAAFVRYLLQGTRMGRFAGRGYRRMRRIVS